jgi:hypothetical protein
MDKVLDAPLNSLMDSTTSPKLKTTKGKGIGARSLTPNILGVERHVGAPGWDYNEQQAIQLFTQTCTNEITNWLVQSRSIFVARTSHKQTQTHKTHHGLDLGEATTFPLIVYFVFGHRANTQMSFCHGSPEIPKIGTLAILEAHNFA